ncbi:hypothetical protein LT337_12395 [Mycolicibacterium fortuitum]|uniref:hypothetical protein n=1 Tax=Mycolicibacterium conceptionense TaxID=451644 RepID=UPI003204885F|nr:hypothetical protein LT337_12395 [Mycolicibacterium fortuitum]
MENAQQLGFFPESDARLDPRRLSAHDRAAILDSEYNKLMAACEGTYWLTAGPETSTVWQATYDTFIQGIWPAAILCAHATCERTLASLMSVLYAIHPEPKGWRGWGLGRYVGHMTENSLIDAHLIDEIQIVVDARKPLVHWRGPLEVDSLQRVGVEAALRGEDGGEALDRHIAQLAFLCARTAMRVHFGDLTRDIVKRNR